MSVRPRVSVFIATSLDCCIAREDGGLDWLDAANARVPAGEDCGYQAFYEDTDLLVMGRATFDKVLSFPDWPFGTKPVVVLTRRPLVLPAALAASVTASAEAPASLLERLAGEGVRHVYLDGGATIQRFLAAGLVDRLVITTIPVVLGAGRPLFGPLPAEVNLALEWSRAYPFGFVQASYRVLPPT